MSQVKQFQAFKLGLAGYVELTFAEYREKIAPLLKKSAWTGEEADYVGDLVRAGAGPALQAFFGSGHGAAVAVLGKATLAPEPMPKDKIDAHMHALTKSCQASGWSARQYVAFAAYSIAT